MHAKTWINFLKHYADLKMPGTKLCILYDFVFAK